MKGWFFGSDETRERFGVNLTLVTTATLSRKKSKVPPVLTFYGDGDQVLYTVRGKRAEKTWEQFRAHLEKEDEKS